MTTSTPKHEMVGEPAYGFALKNSENLWDAQTISQLLDAELDDATLYRVETYADEAI